MNAVAEPRKSHREILRLPYAEATYICDSCGEEIVVPVDISAGAHQDYVEDCPVCCHPIPTGFSSKTEIVNIEPECTTEDLIRLSDI